MQAVGGDNPYCVATWEESLGICAGVRVSVVEEARELYRHRGKRAEKGVEP